MNKAHKAVERLCRRILYSQAKAEAYTAIKYWKARIKLNKGKFISVDAMNKRQSKLGIEFTKLNEEKLQEKLNKANEKWQETL